MPLYNPPGVTGATGPQGPTGSIGPQGSPGVTGATGPTGPQGNQGSPGVTGATGPQGAQGSPGITGSIGPAGPVGTTIPSGYISPVLGFHVIGDNYRSAPTGSAFLDMYIVASGATGGWTGLDGHLLQYGYSTVGASGWADVTGSILQAGQMFIVGPTGPRSQVTGYLPTGSFANRTGQIAQLLSNAPGASYTFSVPTTGLIAMPAGANALAQDFQLVYDALNGGWIKQVNLSFLSEFKTASYNVGTDDGIIQVGAITQPITITLPLSSVIQIGNTYTVKDVLGNAATYNITVSGNGKNIDGSPNLIINNNYAAYTFIYNGNNWTIVYNNVTPATGPQGSPGVTGPTGPIGSQGSPGVTGATGPQGAQGSPGITGVTGNPGINAYSTTPVFTQPAVNAAIALQIPSGYWLQQGQAVYIPSGGYYQVASGAVPTFSLQNLGYSGVNIPVGSLVSAAFISPAGIAGNTGATGPQGNQGSPGVTGPTGAQGATGVTGPTGPQGNQGSPGVTGATGLQGINAYSTTPVFTQPALNNSIAIQVPSGNWMQIGQNIFIASGGYYRVASGAVPTFSIQNLGYSGYNIPVGSLVSAAFVSPAGVPGVTGFTGPTGPQGNQGSPGITGATGPTGPTGPQGATGVTGAGGINAYSSSAGFTQPAVNASVNIQIPSGNWIQIGQSVFIPSGGYYQVAGGSVPTFSLQNLGYSGANIPVGSLVSAAFISPAGVAGVTGATGTIGSTGPTGPQGATGVQGATGPTGPAGPQGATGVAGYGAIPFAYNIFTGYTGLPTSTTFTAVPSSILVLHMDTTAWTQWEVAGSIGITGGTGYQWQGDVQVVIDGIGGPVSRIGQVGMTGPNTGGTATVNKLFTVNNIYNIQLTAGYHTGYVQFRTASGYRVPWVQFGELSAVGLEGVLGPLGPTGGIGPTGPTGAAGVTGATGPTGPQGATGVTGAPGINAYSTTPVFTQPAVNAAIAIQVPSGTWMQKGQAVYIPSGGYYKVASGAVPTFSLQNLGYSGANIPVGSLVSAAFISPAGIAGPTGVTGPTGPQGATGPQGPAATPGGANTYVQFNDGGSFNGESHFTYTKTTGIVAVQADGTGYLTIGSTVAGTGDERVKNGFTSYFRNNANSADKAIIGVDTSDNLYFGSPDYASAVSPGQIFINPASFGYLSIGNSTIALWASASFNFHVNPNIIDGSVPAAAGGYTVLYSYTGGHAGSVDAQGNVCQSGILTQALSANASTTATTGVTTNHLVVLAASEIWALEVYFDVNFPTSGSKFYIVAPSGATIEGSFVTSNSAGGVQQPRVTALNTFTAALAAGLSNGSLTGHFLITNGATAGDLQVGFASANSGETTTIYAGSYIRASISTTA